MAEYKKQYNRMSRWLEKIEEIAEMGEREINPVELQDLFITYFQTCYHLKDYLKNDPNVGVSESSVESFIDTTDCMTVCADICNATKHLYLNGSGRSGEDPELSEGAHVIVNAAKGESSATYKVEMDTGEKDAYELAKECKDAWDSFLQSNSLSVPS